MKKTLQITLAETLLTVEESAYLHLQNYLEEISLFFASSPNKEEIILDIETRIVELLEDHIQKVITLRMIEGVLTSIGSIEDFSEEEGSIPTIPSKTLHTLYRSTDDVMIAGVCSGIATYLGVEAIWIRLLFLLLLIFTGTGFWIYLLCWILIPEANTPSQKLEMRGSPVTINSLSQLSSHQTKARSHIEQILAIPFDMFQRVCIPLLPPLLRIFGMIMSIVSLLSIIGISLLSTAFYLRIDRLTDIPLQDFLSTMMINVLFISGTIVLILPLIITTLLGVSLYRKKSYFRKPLVIMLVSGVFIVSSICTFSALYTYEAYQSFIAHDPAYALITESIPLEQKTFSHITIASDIPVEIVEGSVPSLTFTGRRKELVREHITSDEHLLRIETKTYTKKCLLCDKAPGQFTLVAPNVSTILATGNSTVAGSITGPAVHIILQEASQAHMRIQSEHFSTELSQGSRAYISGSASGSTLHIDDHSMLRAEELISRAITIRATDSSRAFISGSQLLEANASTNAEVLYGGDMKKLQTSIRETSGGKVTHLSETEL